MASVLKEIPLNEKAALFLLNGKIIGGLVIERSTDWIRLRDAFEIGECKSRVSAGASYLPN